MQEFQASETLPAETLGERGGDRTHDHLIKSQVLYQLSYPLTPKAAEPSWVILRGQRANRSVSVCFRRWLV